MTICFVPKLPIMALCQFDSLPDRRPSLNSYQATECNLVTKSTFEFCVLVLGALFTVCFCVIVIPPLLASGDVIGAFAAGFVNPYSSGYSIDVIICAFILIVWVLYERKHLGIRHGWVAIPLSFIPGVAVAFAVYLVMRSRQLAREENAA